MNISCRVCTNIIANNAAAMPKNSAGFPQNVPKLVPCPLLHSGCLKLRFITMPHKFVWLTSNSSQALTTCKRQIPYSWKILPAERPTDSRHNLHPNASRICFRTFSLMKPQTSQKQWSGLCTPPSNVFLEKEFHSMAAKFLGGCTPRSGNRSCKTAASVVCACSGAPIPEKADVMVARQGPETDHRLASCSASSPITLRWKLAQLKASSSVRTTGADSEATSVASFMSALRRRVALEEQKSYMRFSNIVKRNDLHHLAFRNNMVKHNDCQ